RLQRRVPRAAARALGRRLRARPEGAHHRRGLRAPGHARRRREPGAARDRGLRRERAAHQDPALPRHQGLRRRRAPSRRDRDRQPAAQGLPLGHAVRGHQGARAPGRGVHARLPAPRRRAAPAAMRRRLPLACAALWLAGAAAAQEYSFDVAAFEKKPLELGGRAELRAERVALDPDSALYRLNLYDRAAPAHLDRTAAVLELNGLYRAGSATFQATAHAESASDELDHEDRSRLYEAYVALEPETGTRLEAGKRVLRWGKGYAFNPVAFLERPKDPNDPELAREGFVILGAGVTRSLAGPLAAVSFTPVLVPTDDHINEDFGPGDHWNPGARLALLYRDTDIDLLALGA